MMLEIAITVTAGTRNHAVSCRIPLGADDFSAIREQAIRSALQSATDSMLRTLRAERDAEVKTIPSDDAERFICLAHPHNHRWEEAMCSAKYQLDAAVRERDMWQRRALSRIALQAECDDLRARLAACERVVEAAVEWADNDDEGGEPNHTLWQAVCAYRAAVAAAKEGA